MKLETTNRWALSFADLIMLLLAFFVMLQAQTGDRAKMVAGIRGAFGGSGHEDMTDSFAAAAMFEPGQAILKSKQRDRFARIGADAGAGGERIIVSAIGRDAGSTRLDSWEMAAARTAAVARAIAAGGLPETRIEIAIAPPRQGNSPSGLRIRIEHIRA